MDLAIRRPAMPWREVSVMEQRREFVRLAMQEGANRRELCRRFAIHPQTGYKWLARWQANQEVADQSRRPRSSPRQTEGAIEQRIVALRDTHPAWGARKIARCLKREDISPSGERWTRFEVWLLKLGIGVIHSRPYHPQSRKNERFHRTLNAEVLALRRFRDLAETQRAFDAWREVYNFERPHEALDQEVPASRYQPSKRAMPDRLPEPEYDSQEIVRTVPATKAYISFKGKMWKVPQAFRGERL